MARFRVETIPLCDDFSPLEETAFLELSMRFLRDLGADVVIPATTNTIFRTFPLGAEAAPYGSYAVDLRINEEALWKNIHRITRQNINTARKAGVRIIECGQDLARIHSLIRATFAKSRLPFMSREALVKYIKGLGEYSKVLTAEFNGNIQSCVVYAFSKYCAYAVYGGNVDDQQQGANKLLHWEAIRSFKQLGVQRYDFVGARINPPRGSKQEAINSFKSRLGGQLRQGYLWKYRLHPVKALAYELGVRVLRGGDIVDFERRRARYTASHR